MNAITKDQVTALSLPERAAVALGETANAAKLRELVAQSAGIVAVTNADGRAEAHRAGMVLLKTRTGIRSVGKAARDDATKFSKAVIAMEDEMIAIIEPEELRVLALRDAFDEQIEAEKQAKIKAERERMEAIQSKLDEINSRPSRAVGVSSAGIGDMICDLTEAPVTAELFAERLADAETLKAQVLVKLEEMRVTQAGIEQAAAAEQARVAAAALAAEQAAEVARQKVENDRVAAENAAAARKIAEQQAALELAAKQQREAAEAAQRAEAEKARQAQAAANAEIKAAQDALNAKQAAFEMAQRVEVDHAQALAMNAQYDAGMAICAAIAAEDVARCAATAKAMLTGGRSLMPELCDDDEDPSDDEIVDAYVEAFGGSRDAAAVRLAKFAMVPA